MTKSLCFVVLATLLAVPARSEAALFEATYAGEVGGSLSGPLALQTFPLGTPISFTLIFDDHFLSDDSTVVFSPARPAAGSVTIGASTYQLTSHDIETAMFTFNPAQQLLAANYHFLGTGPVVDGLEFIGLFVRIQPDLALQTGTALTSVSLGWDTLPGPQSNFDYVTTNELTQQFSVQPVAVPGAPLGVMMLAGMGAVSGRRWWRSRRLRALR
jgi:hypothetical protein